MTAATRTPAQRGTANRRKGHQAERDLAKYLRTVGFPQAERAVVTGFAVTSSSGEARSHADPGDIAGVPATIISVKDCGAETIEPWLAELDAMATLAGEGAGLRLLVHKRRGTAPGRWWCWMRQSQHASLVGGRSPLEFPVRAELRFVVAEMHRAGYGSPSEVSS